MAHHYDLPRATSFRSFVKSYIWDERNFQWRATVNVCNGNSTEVQHWISDAVIQCVSQLDRPKFGTTPGLENFKGRSWHTNLWPKDAKLDGKKFAIIGCRSSTAQIILSSVDQVEHLVVYMRAPPVVLSRRDFALSRYHSSSARSFGSCN